MNRRLFLQILKEQKIPEQSLQALDPARKHLTTEDEKVEAFEVVQSRTRVMNYYLEGKYDLLPVTARPPSTDPICVVQVFAIPELMGQIMLYLDPRSICQAAQACKAMADALSVSSKLERKLSLVADTTCFTHSIFEDDRSSRLRCYVQEQRSGYASPSPSTPANYGELLIRFSARALPRLGLRPSSIFVCQPPITEMLAYVDGCRCKEEHQRGTTKPCLTITNSKGITYGVVVDEARKLRREHVNRPQNHSSSHSLSDEEFPPLTFAARVPIQAGHPLLREPSSP